MDADVRKPRGKLLRQVRADRFVKQGFLQFVRLPGAHGDLDGSGSIRSIKRSIVFVTGARCEAGPARYCGGSDPPDVKSFR